jgi:hypothetical protein
MNFLKKIGCTGARFTKSAKNVHKIGDIQDLARVYAKKVQKKAKNGLISAKNTISEVGRELRSGYTEGLEK